MPVWPPSRADLVHNTMIEKTEYRQSPHTKCTLAVVEPPMGAPASKENRRETDRMKTPISSNHNVRDLTSSTVGLPIFCEQGPRHARHKAP
jgi:hypothetical protein